MRTHFFLALVLAVAAAPVGARIYGLVDENGVAHLTELPVEGYMLFKNDAPAAALQIDPAAPPSTGVAARRTARAPAPAPIPVRVIRQPYSDLVAKVAREQQVDAALLHAVVTVESGYNPRALSPKGARGLMQLMPGTAQRFGVKDSWNPLQNLRGGARYLRHLLLVFNNNLNLALAAYNAGEGAVIDSGRAIPPYP
ncbi:MAG TPA: lytic transglycosylase domain-containing protein, partial [Burkholderiales bacterium]|nr:lytic transglycosylase domain-containing protein [Burkholderiales bacterium]